MEQEDRFHYMRQSMDIGPGEPGPTVPLILPRGTAWWAGHEAAERYYSGNAGRAQPWLPTPVNPYTAAQPFHPAMGAAWDDGWMYVAQTARRVTGWYWVMGHTRITYPGPGAPWYCLERVAFRRYELLAMWGGAPLATMKLVPVLLPKEELLRCINEYTQALPAMFNRNTYAQQLVARIPNGGYPEGEA